MRKKGGEEELISGELRGKDKRDDEEWKLGRKSLKVHLMILVLSQ